MIEGVCSVGTIILLNWMRTISFISDIAYSGGTGETGFRYVVKNVRTVWIKTMTMLIPWRGVMRYRK
jgi:hypothetical protein